MKTFFSFRNFSRNMALSVGFYLLLVFNLLAMPVSWQETMAADTLPRQESTRTTSYSSNSNSNSTSTQISINGKILLTDDEKDIKSISPGGYFRYSQTTFGNKREVYIQGNSDGSLKRQYFVGRTEEPYEPAGREWLAEALQDLVKSGFGAEERVKRIYAKNGVKGVMNEITELKSDHAKGTYYGYLLQQPSLKDNEIKALLEQLNTKITSSHDKARILQKVSPKYLQNDKVLAEYLTTVSGIGSDHEMSRILSHALQNGKLNAANYTQVLAATSKISSDYEQARILKQVLANPNLTTQAHKQAIALLPTITSDYEKASIISSLTGKKEYVDANFGELLKATSLIKSSHDKSRVLNKIVSSSPGLTSQQCLQLLPMVGSITSDYDKTKVLLQLKPNLPLNNTEVRAEYIKVAKTIKSDHDYRRAIDGLL